ncbi:ATP-binding cassette domain-containing protein [Sneathiella chungangensis]|uniref:ATP-binding cassette domain-containing protein n=1 Tax=Sneathiella chungangensis TaxID=1418234 RepID=A0A845ME58_9PROT|nr:ATP-binding cassette domain-containing protein [Sneathiella chungangensis]MZR21981.1 ATP-binding cassette domain-containing protein [Sneathiella chungangensis]
MTERATKKIVVKDLRKSFDGVPVLNGINLEVKTGEILTLIGPSGSGKTLTLKCILGLVKPDSGSILLDGEDVKDMPERDRMEFFRNFGILFQRSGLFDGLRVWENIGFRLSQQPGMRKRQVKAMAIEKLRSVGLSADVADLYPAELSGGMQKRVGFARAIAGDPPILFLDEPTAGLDPIMSNVINDQIFNNVRELGSTVMAITSNLLTARIISDRIAMLHEGRVVWTGDVQEAVRSENPYVSQFWNKRKDGPIQMSVSTISA